MADDLVTVELPRGESGRRIQKLDGCFLIECYSGAVYKVFDVREGKPPEQVVFVENPGGKQ